MGNLETTGMYTFCFSTEVIPRTSVPLAKPTYSVWTVGRLMFSKVQWNRKTNNVWQPKVGIHHIGQVWLKPDNRLTEWRQELGNNWVKALVKMITEPPLEKQDRVTKTTTDWDVPRALSETGKLQKQVAFTLTGNNTAITEHQAHNTDRTNRVTVIQRANAGVQRNRGTNR